MAEIKIVKIVLHDSPRQNRSDWRPNKWGSVHPYGQFAKPRIHVFMKGENILENLVERWSRPHWLYREEIVPAAIEKLGLPSSTRVVWSQKAGCPCGCSPAFIVQTEQRGQDVFVDATWVRSVDQEQSIAPPIDVLAQA